MTRYNVDTLDYHHDINLLSKIPKFLVYNFICGSLCIDLRWSLWEQLPPSTVHLVTVIVKEDQINTPVSSALVFIWHRQGYYNSPWIKEWSQDRTLNRTSLKFKIISSLAPVYKIPWQMLFSENCPWEFIV